MNNYPTTSPDQDNPEFVSSVMSALRDLNYDVSVRNLYMNKRDSYVYGTGLWENLEIPDGNNSTLYNFLQRVVDIHTSQLMGRGFQVYSTYLKDDNSVYDDTSDPKGEQRKTIDIRNKQKQAEADSRKRIIDAIIRDNGGMETFKAGARSGSLYGTTVYKMWFDKDSQKIKIVQIESPQNYYGGWSDTDFRKRDYDAYVYQMSVSQANRLYGSKLRDEQDWQMTPEGSPFGQKAAGDTSDPISQNRSNPDIPTQTQRQMVTCIDFTGYLDGWAPDGKGYKRVRRGDEKPCSVLIVGGCVVQSIKDEKNMPKYYVINNRHVPRRSWGESDLPDAALEINADYIERMSDYVTLLNKTVFPMYQMKGFDPASLPRKKQREVVAVSMTADQSIELVQSAAGALAQEFTTLLNEQKEAFVKITGIGRVLFDDPKAASDSNQAMMTTMKGVIDIVEDKQARWSPALLEMFNDALILAGEHIPEVKEVIETDDDWNLRVEWPSVLRREDATYQTTWLNLHNAGVISLDTYLEKIGIENISEELDRIRDNMKDPITAAVMGKQLGEVAHQAINTALGIPPWGYVIPKVSLRGEMTPQQEANMAQNFGWGDGPFGNSIGPQGTQGDAANQNEINQGTLNGNPFNGGQPVNTDAQGNVAPVSAQNPEGQAAGAEGGQAAAPMMTPDNNTGAAPTSQPGSGRTATSAKGAVKKHNQNHGR